MLQTSEIIWLAASTAVLLVLYLFARKHIAAKYVLLAAFLGLNLVYLIWRTAFTLPTVGIISLIVGILLLVTEWAGYLQSIVFTVLSWKPFQRKTIPLSAFEELPTVDVYIATYNEPGDLLKRTIVASQMMHYPKEKLKVYVCDDGRRAAIRELTESLGAYYLDRPDNMHQKAGNLNAAMTKTDGEIIVTMDADMVPRANFLERTIGHFTDEKVSFVQAPQVFYNSDAFQYNLFFEENITNEQDFFMRRLEEGKDRFNATMYVGSNALFRRSALEAIGGFATGVITEDMATGMLLQTKGQKTVFVNETLAVGLSPETYADLLKQRDRWCRGNIQVIRKWNPLTIKGLSFMQRLLYMDGIHYWLFGIYKMVYLLAPLLFLLFGIYSLQTDFSTLVLYWLPAFLSSQLAFRRMADNKRTTLWSHVYEVALAPYMALSVLTELFLRKTIKFNVTRKGILNNRRHFLWRTSTPYVILLAMSLASLIMIGIDLCTPIQLYHNVEMLYINIFWVLYNAVALVMALIIAVERPRFREAERIDITIEAQMENSLDGAAYPARIIDLSEYGARLELLDVKSAHMLSAGAALTLCAGPLQDVQLRKHWVSQQGTSYYAGVSFQDVTQAQYRSLVQMLFVDAADIYSNREYVNSTLWRAATRFFRQTKAIPKQAERQSIRETIAVPGILHTERNHKMETTLLDYSLSGCQVELRKSLKPGQILRLYTNHNNFYESDVRVQWVQKRGRKYLAGLRFLTETADSDSA
ncbi:glycosyltransferase family 2 protein [Terribacillus halophilus]|uniref:glycosyltransferase family 2 protein n=1 Tax=Terribacillus halophilus TaxID=361279 RepID=UPI0009846EFC|nr:glycosyltransferase family 2 protein [Terribacillus halophilus]